jgi:hypothetical protein
LGNLAGAHTEAVARKELAKLILDWSKNAAGTTHAKAKDIDKNLIETQLNVLNQEHLRKIYQSAEQEAKGNRMAETYIQKLNASMPSDSASFILKNQVSAQGKMDAELIITLESGKEVNTGMSLKNYNMESGGSLALQKSGFLWNYLIDSPTRNFTEHILNIYAKRDEEITGDANAIAEEQAAREAVSELIEPARKALYATLLFSALTGYNQGRTGREASLLVLYSKNQS